MPCILPGLLRKQPKSLQLCAVAPCTARHALLGQHSHFSLATLLLHAPWGAQQPAKDREPRAALAAWHPLCQHPATGFGHLCKLLPAHHSPCPRCHWQGIDAPGDFAVPEVACPDGTVITAWYQSETNPLEDEQRPSTVSLPALK